MLNRIIQAARAQWTALPAPLRRWLRGAEVTVVTAVVASCVGAPMADLHSKAGIAKFAAGVAATAYAALRLYIAQSPVQQVIAEVQESTQTKTVTPGGTTTESATKTTTLSGPEPEFVNRHDG